MYPSISVFTNQISILKSQSDVFTELDVLGEVGKLGAQQQNKALQGIKRRYYNGHLTVNKILSMYAEDCLRWSNLEVWTTKNSFTLKKVDVNCVFSHKISISHESLDSLSKHTVYSSIFGLDSTRKQKTACQLNGFYSVIPNGCLHWYTFYTIQFMFRSFNLISKAKCTKCSYQQRQTDSIISSAVLSKRPTLSVSCVYWVIQSPEMRAGSTRVYKRQENTYTPFSSYKNAPNDYCITVSH